MARTPLLSNFQGLYRDFAEGRQTGVTRRDFLKAAGPRPALPP